MIYRFSSEEKKGLYLLESEQVEAIRKCEKVFTQYGDKSPEAEEAFKILKNEIIELERKFNVEWERLENVRFEKLNTPRSILDDAKQQAKDSIYYTYVRLWTASEKDLPRSEAKEDRMIIDMAKGELKVHLGNWDFENIIENFKELYAPEDSPLLLDATGMQIYIERDIIKRHFDALRGLPEEKELQDAITDIIEESPYTISKGIKDNSKPLVNIGSLMRSPLSDIQTFGLMNDKINAQLIQGDFFTKEANGQLTISFAVDQAPKSKKQAAVYMSLTYEGTEGNLTKRMSAFDNAVYNAVATRFYYWQQENTHSPLYITPQEIWRTMNGKKAGDGKAKPGKTQLQRICDSLDKMRFLRFYMDISEEIQAFNLYIEDDRVVDGKIDTYVLNSSLVEFRTEKGKIIQGYKIGEEPILYTYNRSKKCVLYVPYEMLDTSSNISDSENVTEFRNYLLQQIQLMKGSKENPDNYFQRNETILIDTIYKCTGILSPEERIANKTYKNDASRQKEVRRLRKSDREKIEAILDVWKTKKWISNYIVLNSKNEPAGEKQQVKGYKIQL